MLTTYKNPKKKDWPLLLSRPAISALELQDQVRLVLEKVQNEGDAALFELTEKFDGVKLDKLLVSESEFIEADSIVESALKQAIIQAAANIRMFHSNQLIENQIIETQPGVSCWRKSVGIEKVGLYVPGGTAPLFSTVLMLGIPANLANCKEITLCTPPGKDGKINPAILFAARLVGVSKVYKLGGSQAIAAMAYGTESVPKCYKIFGPGNQYVSCAKTLVSLQGTAIDLPAGPSEVAIIIDSSSNPAFVASDLLSQAEHGPDSQVILFTCDEGLIAPVNAELNRQLEQLPRKEMAAISLSNSRAFVLSTKVEMIEMANEYAAEHLIIATDNPMEIGDQISNAGSIFLGHYSPESAGDYASGTNHTLPTGGFAKMYSGVSVDSFVKKISFQEITKQGLKNLGPTVELMAEAELLQAHKNAVTIRLKTL